MHSRKWKRRFCVLYRVPLAHVLVYYDTNDVSVEHVMGFVDMRRASAVEVSVDGDQHILRVATPKRTFVFLPETVNQVREAAVHRCAKGLTLM